MVLVFQSYMQNVTVKNSCLASGSLSRECISSTKLTTISGSGSSTFGLIIKRLPVNSFHIVLYDFENCPVQVVHVISIQKPCMFTDQNYMNHFMWDQIKMADTHIYQRTRFDFLQVGQDQVTIHQFISTQLQNILMGRNKAKQKYIKCFYDKKKPWCHV